MTDAAEKLQNLCAQQGKKFPRKLAAGFPHVVDQLLNRWKSKAAMDSLLTDLLIPSRPGRAGFPPDVVVEIMELQKSYDAVRPATADDKDTLLSPDEARKELERIGLPRTINNFARAAEAGDHSACLLFIGSGFSVDIRDSRHWTPLMIAAFNGREVLALKLIQQGADVHAQDNRGYRPMHWAAFNGYIRVTQLLISKGADVNVVSQARITPLIQAAARGHLDVCTELLNQGANPNAIAGDGATALLKAVANDHAAIVNLLLAVGAKPEAELKKGKTLIEIAMTSRIPEIQARIASAAQSRKKR